MKGKIQREIAIDKIIELIKIDADSIYVLRKFKTEFRHGMALIDDKVVAILFKDSTSLAVIGSEARRIDTQFGFERVKR